jgi:hypothetical protein
MTLGGGSADDNMTVPDTLMPGTVKEVRRPQLPAKLGWEFALNGWGIAHTGR